MCVVLGQQTWGRFNTGRAVHSSYRHWRRVAALRLGARRRRARMPRRRRPRSLGVHAGMHTVRLVRRAAGLAPTSWPVAPYFLTLCCSVKFEEEGKKTSHVNVCERRRGKA